MPMKTKMTVKVYGCKIYIMINTTLAQNYCSEDISKIENYDKAVADTKTWDIHHRLEIQGQFRNSAALLIKCGLYFDVPASQLIFLSHGEHTRLHNFGNTYIFGKKLSAQTRAKMSASQKGRTFSAEAIEKMRIAHKGKRCSDETKAKMSAAHAGRCWWNDDKVQVLSFKCPEGFKRGMLKKK